MKRYCEGFAHYQWNPVTGCSNNCDYCPARTLAKGFAGDTRANLLRVKGIQRIEPLRLYNCWEISEPVKSESGNGKYLDYPMGFDLTLHRYRMSDDYFPKTPSTIAVCPMTDLFSPGTPLAWREIVVDAARRHPEHEFIFHTKRPWRMDWQAFGKNCWVGTHIGETNERTWFSNNGTHAFTIFDPLDFTIDMREALNCMQCSEWVMIGAIEKPGDIGRNRPDSIKAICDAADEMGIPVWMMTSCSSMYSGELRRELPAALEKHEPSIAVKNIRYKRCGVCKAEMPAKEMLRLSRMTKQRTDRGTTFCYLCPECEKRVQSLIDGDVPLAL